MAIRRVNRTTLDGSTVTLGFGRHEIPCLSISYGDSLETDTVTPMGKQRIEARTPGAYKTEQAKVKMESVVFREQLAPLLSTNGFGNVSFPLTVSYSHPDTGDDSDLLDECRIVTGSLSAENSNAALAVEFSLDFNQLYLTDKRLTINRVDDNSPTGTSQF